MNASCPHCETTFRIDPSKVPAGGVRARCSVCRGVFPVAAEAAPVHTPPARPDAAAAPTASSAPAAPAAAPTGAFTPPQAAPAFGSADPHGKARRLARALISDIVVYHPDRRERSLRDGTLRQEFREEIRKSWEEYAGQVGDQIARGTPYFRDALNEILAGGQQVF